LLGSAWPRERRRCDRDRGNRGNGFSAQLDALTTLAMPELLEEVARQLREGGGTA
jgi:hypothetical protein